MTDQTKKLMDVLGLNEAEALQLQEDDKRIDKGEKLFELSDELKAGAKKARQAERKPTAYKFTKRERKADTDKAHLMKILEIALKYNPDCEAFEMVNAERECLFTYHGRKFKIVLSAPRS